MNIFLELIGLDRVYFRDLKLRGILGINDWERRERQDILIDVDLWTDVRRAAKNDDFEACVDYRALKKTIVGYVEGSQFRLVETLAERVAELCLADARVVRARVKVEKPGALRFARTVGVEVTRGRHAP